MPWQPVELILAWIQPFVNQLFIGWQVHCHSRQQCVRYRTHPLIYKLHILLRNLLKWYLKLKFWNCITISELFQNLLLYISNATLSGLHRFSSRPEQSLHKNQIVETANRFLRKKSYASAARAAHEENWQLYNFQTNCRRAPNEKS